MQHVKKERSSDKCMLYERWIGEGHYSTGLPGFDSCRGGVVLAIPPTASVASESECDGEEGYRGK